jgi:tetratricopeptide (TPR) repeat protein
MSPAAADTGRGHAVLLAMSNEVRSMCDHAQRLIHSRRYPEAFDILNRALAMEPDCAEAHGFMGLALQNSGNPQQAIQAYQRALQLNPSMTFMYLNIGNCYLNLGQPDAARPYLEHYRQVSAGAPGAARAESALRRAQEVHDHQAFRQMVEQAELALEQRKFAEARRRFEQVVATRPDYAHGHFQLGYAWNQLGDNQKAIQEFQTALHLDPKMKAAVMNIASSYQSLGDTGSAIAWFERYLGMNPPAADAEAVKKTIALLRKAGPQMGSPDLPDYLDDSALDGRFIRWPREKLPLRVFVDSGASVQGYRDSLRQVFDEALAAWQKGCGYRLSFAQASSAAEANIAVSWSSDYAGVKGQTTGAEAGLTVLEIEALPTGERVISSVTITLLTVDDRGVPVTDVEMKKTCLHEIGHALGIRGHSSNNRDVMFFSESGSVWPALTKRDKATLTRLYADYPPQVVGSQ